jgi:hypothetical protein
MKQLFGTRGKMWCATYQQKSKRRRCKKKKEAKVKLDAAKYIHSILYVTSVCLLWMRNSNHKGGAAPAVAS